MTRRTGADDSRPWTATRIAPADGDAAKSSQRSRIEKLIGAVVLLAAVVGGADSAQQIRALTRDDRPFSRLDELKPLRDLLGPLDHAAFLSSGGDWASVRRDFFAAQYVLSPIVLHRANVRSPDLERTIARLSRHTTWICICRDAEYRRDLASRFQSKPQWELLERPPFLVGRRRPT